MAGCLNCSSIDYCYDCDEDNGYYLSESSCKLIMKNTENDSYTYGQSAPGIILQFNVPDTSNSTQYTLLRNVSGELGTAIKNNSDNSTVQKPVKLSNPSSTISGGIITVRLNHPN